MDGSLSRDQVREVDRRAIEEYGLPGIVLMENAGRGAAELLLGLDVKGPVVLCCGRGNNGGDGFVIARHLDLAGCDVRILLFTDPAQVGGDAAIALKVARTSGLPIDIVQTADNIPRDILNTADWIVDALLGTGSQGPPREPYASAIRAINDSGRPVLAIDLPSGMNCDTGIAADPCIRARHTATFVAHKTGFQHPDAAQWTGEVSVISIGAPRCLLAEFLPLASKPPPQR